MKDEEKTITGVYDLLDKLKEFERDKEHEYFFRGHSKTTYTLKPSIYRNNNIKYEARYFKELISKVPQEFSNEKTTIEKLVKMQHYGLPTRLLDITTNPLVALYIACKEHPNSKENGEFFIFKVHKDSIKFYDSDTVTILANLAKMPVDFNISSALTEYKNSNDDKNKRIKRFNDTILYLLHEIKDDKSYFLPIVDPEDFARVIPVKVKNNNHRIIRQNGAFFLFGIAKTKEQSVQIPPAWPKGSFLIPNEYKSEIKKELDVLGINQSTLFPELDKQAEYLKELYS